MQRVIKRRQVMEGLVAVILDATRPPDPARAAAALQPQLARLDVRVDMSVSASHHRALLYGFWMSPLVMAHFFQLGTGGLALRDPTKAPPVGHVCVEQARLAALVRGLPKLSAAQRLAVVAGMTAVFVGQPWRGAPVGPEHALVMGAWNVEANGVADTWGAERAAQRLLQEARLPVPGPADWPTAWQRAVNADYGFLGPGAHSGQVVVHREARFPFIVVAGANPA